MPPYVPRKGDLVIITFDPRTGHEQQGRRPALVVSNTLFNKATGLAPRLRQMVCPITRTHRRVPFHAAVPPPSSLTGYVMVEQLKSVDYAGRQVRFVERAPAALLDEVLAILDARLYEGSN